MILERRVIVFPRADLLDAMRRFGEHNDKRLPDTPPDNLTFEPSQDVALSIAFPAANRHTLPTRVTFSCEEVGQALTQYCRDHKVPLPRAANKMVEKYKDGAALTMQVGEAGLQVMVVDDQEMVRAIIRKSLTKTQIAKFHEARNGREALHMLHQADVDPDVILCDLHMETMDGAEFLRQLRADHSNRSCRKPVLILTAEKNEQVLEAVRQHGASKILAKPIAPDELIRQIMLARGYFELNR
ncbi:response regulator [Magnetospirillum aberrantis]|uniref:Response regulator n=1 Tax=Magnetospirillum aberrantis SpK TaxID=908842 RepID=A0A7C9UW80_9PROT|nr:response regulator transcription factor [Magnetospirillum aberrantis]NFV81486.1 response regulator [Magnetospirillum aberrantis SpK]